MAVEKEVWKVVVNGRWKVEVLADSGWEAIAIASQRFDFYETPCEIRTERIARVQVEA